MKGRWRRCCHDCGATDAQATFAVARKPRGLPLRCIDCAGDPLSAALAGRIAARGAELASLRAAGRYRAPKPAYTLPLFCGLRPNGGR